MAIERERMRLEVVEGLKRQEGMGSSVRRIKVVLGFERLEKSRIKSAAYRWKMEEWKKTWRVKMRWGLESTVRNEHPLREGEGLKEGRMNLKKIKNEGKNEAEKGIKVKGKKIKRQR